MGDLPPERRVLQDAPCSGTRRCFDACLLRPCCDACSRASWPWPRWASALAKRWMHLPSWAIAARPPRASAEAAERAARGTHAASGFARSSSARSVAARVRDAALCPTRRWWPLASPCSSNLNLQLGDATLTPPLPNPNPNLNPAPHSTAASSQPSPRAAIERLLMVPTLRCPRPARLGRQLVPHPNPNPTPTPNANANANPNPNQAARSAPYPYPYPYP